MGRSSDGRSAECRTTGRAATLVIPGLAATIVILAWGVIAAPSAVADPSPASSAPSAAAEVHGDSSRPAIALKGSVTRPSAGGQIVTFAYVATNTGETRLERLEVRPSERLADFGCNAESAVGLRLEPGQSASCSGTRTLSQSERDARRVTGAATVRAAALQGDTLVDVSAEVRVAAAIPVQPALTLAKSASRASVSKAGDVITYTFVATNSGNVSLTSVEVSDELAGLGDVTCDQIAPVTLAPGDALTCTAQLVVSQSDMDFGALDNIGEVSGEAPGGDPEDVSDDVVAIADAQVRIDQRPGISMRITVPHTRVVKGEKVVYALSVENTGNVTLTDIELASNLTRLGPFVCSSQQSSALAPGEARTCTASYTVASSDASRGKLVNRLAVRAAAPYATSSSGHVTARTAASITVVRPPAAEPGSPSAPSAGGGLADTGGPSSVLALIGVSLAGGGVLMLARNRRKRI